jgi:formate dehydrogenase major subunit
VVEVEGERTLAPSCCRAVHARHEGARRQRARAPSRQNLVLELLLADLPAQGHKWLDDDAAQPHGELSEWAARAGRPPRDALQTLQREQPAPDLSAPRHGGQPGRLHPVHALRARLPRAQVNDVIGYAGRGAEARIVFDLDDPMGASSCVACGECVQACPTGALMPKTLVGPTSGSTAGRLGLPLLRRGLPDHLPRAGQRIVSVEWPRRPGQPRPAVRQGALRLRLCAPPAAPAAPADPQARRAQGRGACERPPDWRAVFREASWDEALDAGRRRPAGAARPHGPKALAGFGSAKGSNEEAYLFQKLVRTGFGSNNVDHCTRLCHASQRGGAAGGRGLGRGQQPGARRGACRADLHDRLQPHGQPPGGRHLDEERRARGAKIVLADPRAHRPARHAWRTLQFRPTPTWRCSTR